MYLAQTLEYTPGAVILPDGVSVRAWSESFPGAFIDIHPRSLPAQKKNYLALLGENPLVFGTRRMLTKRLGRYKHLYVVYDNLPGDIVFKQRTIPLWMMLDKLERYGHVIHYITTTPHVRTFYDFLQHKKQIHYL